MDIKIDDDLKAIYPQSAMLVLQYDIEVKKSSKELIELQNNVINEIEHKYELNDIVQIPAITATREAYKALGKSPSSYRNAAEAMLRRIVKGNGLYQINNVVDLNNIMSIKTGYSIGSYDLDNVVGKIILKKANDNEHYEGIGKDSINIEFIPTLYDDLSAFGNPTSDSQRTMIQKGNHRVISVIYSFLDDKDFDIIAQEYQDLLNQYTNVSNLEIIIVK